MEKKIEESFKPRTWLLIVLIIIGLAITVVLADKYIKNRNNRLEKIQDLFNLNTEEYERNRNEINERINKAKEEAEERDAEFEVSSFNSSFEMFSGTVWGSSVIHVIDKVITNNKTQQDHLITVNYNGVDTQDEEVIRDFKSNFETFNEYEVIFDYDDNGFINKVTIR